MQGIDTSRRARLKIVIPIISISWHGGTRVLVQLANYLSNLGYEVVFLVSRNRCRTPFELANDVRVINVGVFTRVKAIDYSIFLCIVPFYVGTNAILIANFFVTYYPVRMLWLIKRMPYIYFVQDIESKFRLPLGLVLNPFCNWTYRDRRIVAANGHLRDRLLNEFGTASRAISVGPDRVFYDLSVQSAKKYDVVYFLRKESWKGLDRFQRFVEISKGRLTCLCVSQDESLREAIAGSGAEFCKPRDDRELIQCIDSARCFLLTSYREGFALPPLEGMARGLPAVLFRCGGPDQYVVDGRNAIYVDDEDHAFRAIEMLIADTIRYSMMSDEARQTAEKYRMDNSLKLMEKFVIECSEW
jgi:glycosyltransferase involved in cell wall biosynthesis